jgi:hypothetical protein
VRRLPPGNAKNAQFLHLPRKISHDKCADETAPNAPTSFELLQP